MARARFFLRPFMWNCALFALLSAPALQAATPGLLGTFSEVPAGSIVDLTAEGVLDWVHWGLYTETSLDRKAGVVPQISDFTILDAPTGFAYVYQFADNANGYSWRDGTPTPSATNTHTGVWAYGIPQIGSGFQITAPADTTTRTLNVYVGCYGSRGRFEAFLSDGSAQGYINTSLVNIFNGPGAVYSITYSAASGGQQLIVRWTLAEPRRADGNVTLQAATLTSATANNPPFVLLTSPTNNTTSAVGTPLTLAATANDTDGSVTKVEFFSNGSKLGVDISSPYAYSWNNPPSGFHVITARATDNNNTISESAPVELFVHGSGGTLAGSLAFPPTAVNLTAEGTRDWIHWGLATNSMVNRKANVTPQISSYTKIGDGPVAQYGDNYTAFSWTDGQPTPAANNSRTGIFATGIANGFEITVPADTTRRTLKVYTGLYGAEGNFQAWLSDFSAAAYTDTTLSNFFDNSYGLFSLTYAATSAGQTLTVRYRSKNLFDQEFGNVTLQAATLVLNSSGNVAPHVRITSPTNESVLAAPATFTISADASDDDGTISHVEFFRGATLISTDAASLYTADVTALSSGQYVLSAVAVDNSGARATNSVNITVNNLPSVSIIRPTNSTVFTAPANITIEATAQDADGNILLVEFFNDTTRLGQDTTGPYSLTWSNVAAGTYTLTARATDNHNLSVTSAPVQISIGGNPALPVTLLNPLWSTDGFVFSFLSESGRTYGVDYVNDLGGTWQRLTNIAGTGGSIFVTNKNLPAVSRFYRVEAR